MKVLCCCFLENDTDALGEVAKVENITTYQEINSTSRRGNEKNIDEKVKEVNVTGVLNPTACLHLGDVILFTVSNRHYPQYDL